MYTLVYYKNGIENIVNDLQPAQNETLLRTALDLIIFEVGHTDCSFGVTDANGLQIFTDEDINED